MSSDAPSVRQSRRFVLSDPHGHVDVLRSVLADGGLVDIDGHWVGGDTRLFVLGDFFDRGPDGVGVVDLIMRVEKEAAAAGGSVASLLGNHEALTLGMLRFGSGSPTGESRLAQMFSSSWVRNGGRTSDQERLTDEHVAWLTGLPSIIVDDDLLLLHSDTVEYLAWGDTVEEINAAVRAALTSGDADDAWLCWQRLTDRYAFMNDDGAAVARDLTTKLGGSRIVHGHSILPDLLDVAPTDVTGPWSYADGMVLAIDGGLYAGGPLLLVEMEPAGVRPSG